MIRFIIKKLKKQNNATLLTLEAADTQVKSNTSNSTEDVVSELSFDKEELEKILCSLLDEYANEQKEDNKNE